MDQDSKKALAAYKEFYDSHSLWWRICNKVLFKWSLVKSLIFGVPCAGEMLLINMMMHEEARVHDLLSRAYAKIDPEAHSELADEIYQELNRCKNPICGSGDDIDDQDEEVIPWTSKNSKIS